MAEVSYTDWIKEIQEKGFTSNTWKEGTYDPEAAARLKREGTGLKAGGSSTAKAGNTAEQEKFISGLNTAGALDSGSGFERKFGQGETNEQYSARLEAWKNKGRAGGGGTTPTSATAAVEGLQGAGAGPGQANVSMSGGGGPVDLPAVGTLRQGLGNRIYPDLASALAGLKRIY